MADLANPGYDADMLRRAAEACRNFQKQGVGRVDWFDWVAPWLDGLADQLDPKEVLCSTAVQEELNDSTPPPSDPC